MSRYMRMELSEGEVTLIIEMADHWDDAEIHIKGAGMGKARLSPKDIEDLKKVIAEYEARYQGRKVLE